MTEIDERIEALEEEIDFETAFDETDNGSDLQESELSPTELAAQAPEVFEAEEEQQIAQEPDPFAELEDRLSKRMRNIEGHFGGLKSELMKAMQQQQPAQAPEGGYPQATGEKIQALRDDFPEWSAALDEAIAITQQQMNQHYNPQEFQQAFAAHMDHYVQKTREIARVDAAHPGWEDTVKSQHFDVWASKQPAEMQALIQSPRAADAIKMLDAYQAFNGKTNRNRSRLEGAVTPTAGRSRTGRGASRYQSEQEDFEAGFRDGR